MQLFKRYTILVCLFLGCLPLQGQTFDCSGELILSYNQGAPQNNLTQITFGVFGLVFYSPIKTYVANDFDAIGYNPVDNYIYGVEVNTSQIARLKSDGTTETVGTIDEVESLNASAGDCTPDGRYVFFDNDLDELFIYDVMESFDLQSRTKLKWQGTSEPFTARLDDLVVDPDQPSIAYSFQGDYFDPDLEPFEKRGHFLSIIIDPEDPNFGVVKSISKISGDVIRQIGSLFFTNDGRLWGYGAVTQGPNLRQGTLVLIDRFTGAASRYDGTGPTGIVTDGCSCPYNLSFTNDATPRGLLCSDVTTTYTLTFDNRFYQKISGAVLRDTFPEGMVIEKVSGKYEGTILPGSGAGTRTLDIDDLVIPARGRVSIDIKVKVLDLAIDFNGNQAHLTNLPERYGGSMISDDPQTVDFVGDVTDVWIIATDLEEFTIDIVPPSECLIANDAQVYITSPTLVPGIEYEIKLEDQEFNHSVRNVIIDDNNGFDLDSLLPGTYDLYEINSASAECSFALNDTSIHIIPPNEQLEASAFANTPLCEGEDLQLSASSSPAGTYSWSSGAPSYFRSDLANPTISSIAMADSGAYEMTATYGFCEQIRIMDIDIVENINAKISGDNTYCERDEIRLIAEGEGDIIDFEWQVPDDRDGTLDPSVSELVITTSELTDDGRYNVILDNGTCIDIASIVVSVLDAPSIDLPSFLETEFCDPLVLSPDLESDQDVTFSWSAAGSLSCDDCPNPQVVFPIQPNYELTVTSVNGCQDSSNVNVSLNKEKLLYAPNVFSPNIGSANHDFTMTAGCGLNRINKMTIYNRRGNPVYSKGSFDPQDKSAYWNGLIDGVIAEAGVYVWYAELELADGQIVEMYGDVTLVP